MKILAIDFRVTVLGTAVEKQTVDFRVPVLGTGC